MGKSRQVASGVYIGAYVRVHIPTGAVTTDEQQFLSRTEFLAEMARWNRQGIIWSYREA